MNLQQIKELLKHRLGRILNTEVSSIDLTPIHGGSINQTYQLIANRSTRFFLKLNSSQNLPDLFLKEKSGLEFLASQNCILTPSVFLCEKNDVYQLLLLEWIETNVCSEKFWQKFGEELAHLHSISQQYFGFSEDNYMGALQQVNHFSGSWTEFFINCRLQPQIILAAKNGILERSTLNSFESLFKKLDSIFNLEKPSLLHGDLWSGNFICKNGVLPVLIDPAVYYGHRSMDLAMTTLFGGFDNVFYTSYHYHFPLPVNYREQWEICNLYPLLIHLNLFGESYLQRIENTIQKFG